MDQSAIDRIAAARQALNESPELQEKLMSGGLEMANILAVAKEAGFEFTEEEATAYAQSRPDTEELSDFELQAVSGGKKHHWGGKPSGPDNINWKNVSSQV